jgi:molecular chaperone HscB
MNLQDNYFTLFQLPLGFAINKNNLDAAYLALQSQYHPDRATHLDETTKHRHLIAATHINTAYQTLKNPINRARYLLSLENIDTEEETNTAMPMDFLMSQMQWREDIAEAKSAQQIDALELIHKALRQEMQALDNILAIQIDDTHDYSAAALTVRKYRFYDKLDEEIGNAIESILF